MRQGKILGTLLLLPTFMLAAANIGTLATGQTTQYVAGDDGAYQRGTGRSFTRNTDTVGEEYVIDNITGLMWQDDNITRQHPTNGSTNWTTASTTVCQTLNSNSFGGFNDWRLPRLEELLTLKNGNTRPAFDANFITTIDPMDSTTSPCIQYWSSTEYVLDNTNVYVVDPDSGGYIYSGKDSESCMRCVRGDNYPVSSLSKADDIVTDATTGLMWQDDATAASTTTSWSNAITACENLELGGYQNWRLPNRNEMQSIIDFSKASDPYTDDSVFENIGTSEYWTSTTYADQDKPFVFDLQSFGLIETMDPTYSRRVRCVHDSTVLPTASDYVYTSTVTGAVSFDWNSSSTLNPQDSDGTITTATIKDQAAKGIASISGSSVSYTPFIGQSGSDEFNLTIFDSGGANVAAKVTVQNIDTSSLSATLSYDNTLREHYVNDGRIGDGGVDANLTITLSGDTFTSDVIGGMNPSTSANHITTTNVPTGLTPNFYKKSNTEIIITFSGNANNHASSDSISNLTVTFDDDAFERATAAQVTDSTKSDLTIEFFDVFFNTMSSQSNTWKMVASPRSYYGLNMSTFDSRFLGKSIWGYENGAWVETPTNTDPNTGLWIYPTEMWIPFSPNVAEDTMNANRIDDQDAQIAYLKGLSTNEWHLVGLQQELNMENTVYAITPDSCNGITLFHSYNATNGKWNDFYDSMSTVQKFPQGSAAWVKHICP